jgi:radical SAM-linked protein
MKIRIKFRKYGAMKFVGHLDMMRYFQKAMRRAKIDICYSEGYSPHQIMSFAAPLGVGITSDGEYLDIEVHSTSGTRAAIAELNDTMVDGVEITDYCLLPDNSKAAMSIVAAAEYELFFKDGYNIPAKTEDFKRLIKENILEAAELNVVKETKKGERIIDLKPLIYKISVEEKDLKPSFNIMVSTGSTDNVKPEFVLKTLFDRSGLTYDENSIQIHRIDVFAASENGEGFVPLNSFGTVIAED